MSEWTLSGFGDEIDPDPAVQLAVLRALGSRHIEVRSAWGTNVVELSSEDVDRLARLIKERGMAVSALTPRRFIPIFQVSGAAWLSRCFAGSSQQQRSLPPFVAP